jgi:putative monooxygenase
VFHHSYASRSGNSFGDPTYRRRRVVVAEHEIRKVALNDVAPNRKRGGDIRVLLSPVTVGATSGLFGVLCLAPDEFVAEHYHPYSEEFLYVVAGEVTARLDGEDHALSAGEALAIPREVRHRVRNRGAEPATIVFSLAPLAPRPELGHVDVETLPAEMAR